jgi:hypothetical protein
MPCSNAPDLGDFSLQIAHSMGATFRDGWICQMDSGLVFHPQSTTANTCAVMIRKSIVKGYTVA